jgi:predicted GTPase
MSQPTDSEAALTVVITKLDSIERARTELLAERDALIAQLLPALAAPRLANLTGLTTTGIYKITKRVKGASA